jgi:hypothetical protein
LGEKCQSIPGLTPLRESDLNAIIPLHNLKFPLNKKLHFSLVGLLNLFNCQGAFFLGIMLDLVVTFPQW